MFLVFFIGSEKEKKVFTRFYGCLASILPTQNISHHLVSKEIITTGDVEEIASKARSNDKASIVLRIIDKSLQVGFTSSFYNLLGIMKEYGGDVSSLANEITRALEETSGMYPK